MSAPPRVIYIDKFSVVDCLKDIGGDWEYILKSDYDELQAKLKSTERELAKWKEPFDQEKFDAAAKQASHKDSLAAMCVYQTALEHALKHHQAKLTETQSELAKIYATEPVAVYEGVEFSRYTLRWVNGDLAVGTNFYAAPIPPVEKGAT